MSHRPVCVDCRREMRPKKNGVVCIDMVDTGTEDRPYQLWDSDLWQCPVCGYEILTGFGSEPFAYSHEEDFDGKLKLCKKDLLTVECWQ